MNIVSKCSKKEERISILKFSPPICPKPLHAVRIGLLYFQYVFPSVYLKFDILFHDLLHFIHGNLVHQYLLEHREHPHRSEERRVGKECL